MARTSFASVLVVVAACAQVPATDDPPPTPSAAPIASVAPSASVSAAPPIAPPATGPRLLALGVPIIKSYDEARFHWRLVQHLNWQPFDDSLQPLPPEPVADSKVCPAGMVLAAGGFLLDAHGRDDDDEVMFAQNEACSFWRTEDRTVNGLCGRFDRDKWLSIASKLPRKQMKFCVDEYEYPNRRGEFPLVVSTYAESAGYCAKEGKRLCDENEWTFACEGEEGVPFSTGYERDPNLCPMDILAAGPDKDTFKPRFADHTAVGIDFAFHGKRSGEAEACVSPFGVHDMIGNVDEWTKTARKYGYEMIMKGGHWGPGRHRCRPQTRGHGPHYLRYDQGFRCCAEPVP